MLNIIHPLKNKYLNSSANINSSLMPMDSKVGAVKVMAGLASKAAESSNTPYSADQVLAKGRGCADEALTIYISVLIQ